MGSETYTMAKTVKTIDLKPTTDIVDDYVVIIRKGDPVRSNSGKSILLASSRGKVSKDIEGEQVDFNFNVYKKENKSDSE